MAQVGVVKFHRRVKHKVQVNLDDYRSSVCPPAVAAQAALVDVGITLTQRGYTYTGIFLEVKSQVAFAWV
jgi:hypothetical protein